MKKQNLHLRASSILRRLPVHQQLSTSHALLTKLSPIWQDWCNQNLVAETTLKTTTGITLSHFQNGELIIHCNNALSATQIKQQQQSLLQYFIKSGMPEIKQISVRIANKPNHISNDLPNSPNSNQVNNHLEPQTNLNPTSSNTKKPTKQAVSSIKSCQKMINNDQLSNSLNRLIKTIETLED